MSQTHDTPIYAAPLEGITGYVWRIAHNRIFGGIDKYYTPFISPSSNYEFQTKELRDVNKGEKNLVPQIIANNAEMFLWAARELGEMGYEEVNFNLGCPSGTVVSKGKGSGALRDLEKLDRMLDEIYTALPDMKVSIKTRIGINSPDEWPAILSVYERYPVYELTIHPRVKSQQYKGLASRSVFTETLANTNLQLVYNGDVTEKDDEAFAYGCPVMVGRGVIANPSFGREVRGGEPASKEELIRFHNELLEGYKEYMSGDMPLLHRMKELWHYYSAMFDVTDAQMKKIYKAKKLTEYMNAVNSFMK